MVINPLTPGAFCKKKTFFDILVVFRLDLSQISFNLAETAFATLQLAFLATGIAFYDISTRASTEIKILRVFGQESDLHLCAFRFLEFFFRLSFFSFSFLFAAVIDLLLGSLSVKKTSKKASSRRQFLPWSSQV